MFPIDIRTIFLGYIIINIVNILVIWSLYFQIRKRFPGTFLILLSFIISALGNVFVFLRGVIPDWISIIIGNTLIISSTVLLLIGLEQFVGKKGRHIQNYFLIVIFFFVHYYFTKISPNLGIRNLNISVTYLFLSSQIVWLMFVRTPPKMRKITHLVGIVFGTVFVIQTIRLITVLYNYNSEGKYFNLGNSEALFLLSYEVIIIFLAYGIFLMYNKRLIIDINDQERKFSKVFQSAPFIILLTKFSNGKVLEANDGFEKITNHKIKEIIGLKLADFEFWNNENNQIKFEEHLKEKGVLKELEMDFRKKDGSLFTGLVSAEKLTIKQELCLLLIINDISNRKKTELELKKSEDRLQELNSTKDKFFSIIAHDLKSPFNGIIGFSDLLSEKIKNNDYSRVPEFAEIINKSSKNAMNLLTNLMEWSQVQTGKIKFNPEYLDIISLINSVKELLLGFAEKKSISINLIETSETAVFADKAMIETVLRNLISNAIKFTHQNGEIIISVKKTKSECLISIKDNGIGIERSNLENLFRIDSALSSSGTENEKGTGLGLILCKDFIEKHKGKIWVESIKGVGSTFYFTLPIN